MDFKNGSFAVATDDGMTVSSHFGRARFYEVMNFVDGRLVTRERREKAGHHAFASGEKEGAPGVDHEQRHQSMISPIMDCQVVVVRGMGQGAVDHLRQAKLTPVLTSLHTIEEVIGAIGAGRLDHDPNRIHQHHGRQ
jgi:predicted Fe-Mo cluster-binding NifX family protein